MGKSKAQFRILKGGPIEVTGEYKIKGPDGKDIHSEGPTYLCRCGGSNNKPFCDGTHHSLNFDK